MREVLRNQKLIGKPHLFPKSTILTTLSSVVSTNEWLLDQTLTTGSTMGSHKDMIDATDFMAQHKIVPVVSDILNGLERAEWGFQLLKRADRFGKIVIKMGESPQVKL